MTAKVVLSQAALLDAKAKYEGGAALSEIAGLLGISKKAMGRIFNEAGITIRASRETLLMRSNLPEEVIVDRYAAGESMGAIAKSIGVSQTAIRGLLIRSGAALRPVGARSGSENHQFKGGVVIYDSGYVQVRGARKAPHQHRVIAERALGRKLHSNEIVHHINGDKADNRNSNLLICTQPYHAELHARIKAKYGTYNYQFTIERN